jgi:RNA polymerase sigma factor (sigma-70 family)
LTDQELVMLLQNPETREKAFGILVSLYKERLYWHIRKIVVSHDDTDDVLQNTFIKIYRNIEHFKGDSQLFTWIYRISTNESLSFLKSQSRRQHRTSESLHKALADNLQADVYFEGDEIQLKLQKAIALLPEKQKLIFNMRYFDEIKFKDLSLILGTSEGALKASYHIAMKKIEQFLSSN